MELGGYEGKEEDGGEEGDEDRWEEHLGPLRFSAAIAWLGVIVGTLVEVKGQLEKEDCALNARKGLRN